MDLFHISLTIMKHPNFLIFSTNGVREEERKG